MLALLLVLLLLRLAAAAFVETFDLQGVSSAGYVLDRFVVDVALDTDNELLKFFINTKVYNASLPAANASDAVVTDVNYDTNRYTTFHVDVDFMGKTFILKNLRFCDIVAVKNTSMYESTYRYNSTRTNATTSSVEPATATDVLAGSSVAKRLFNESDFGNSSLPLPSLTGELDFASSNVSVLEFYSNATGDLVQCPLYQNDSIVLYYQADISDHYSRLGSYTVKFSVVSNDVDSTIIGGAKIYATPVLQPRVINSVIFFGVLSLLLVTSVVNYVIVMFSPDQESTNPFLIEASTICNAKLLKQLDADSPKIVGYLQFALFIGGLNIQYPGFYQPSIGQIRWCALLGINVFLSQAMPTTESDNVYVTLHYGGLKSLALYSSNGFIHYSWPNFMICLVSWIGITVVIYQISIGVKLLRSHKIKGTLVVRLILKSNGDVKEQGEERNYTFVYSLQKNVYAHVGNILRQFIHSFGFAFLILTLFMFYTAGAKNAHDFTYDQSMLHENAFSPHIPYQFLIPSVPMQPPLSFADSGDLKLPPRKTHLIPLSSVIGGSIALTIWCGLVLFFVLNYLASFLVRGYTFGVGVSRLYTSVKSVLVWAYFYNAYLPDKVSFVAVDIITMVLSLIVIGLVQMNGTVQVAFLIVIEFIHLILVLTIRPLYVRNEWYSLSSFLHIARFVVAMLCIPFIRALDVSEALRTYVAYTQFIIHVLVLVVFVGHLFYCFGLMIVSAVRHKNELKSSARCQTAATGCEDAFVDQFEYKPIVMPRINNTSGPIEADQLSPQSTGDEEFDYYRSHAEKALLRVQDVEPLTQNTSRITDNYDDEMFNESQMENRRPKTDYTTREGDRIYQKFFTNSSIDPEIRDLWLSRDWKQEGPQKTHEDAIPLRESKRESSFLSSIWTRVRPPKQKGFEVCRPRPLIVKPLLDVGSKSMSSGNSLLAGSNASTNTSS